MGGFSQSAPQLDALRAPIPTLYVMDTYHASSKLVLVGGVRWDPEFFPTDKFGRGSTFNMSNFLAGTKARRTLMHRRGACIMEIPGFPRRTPPARWGNSHHAWDSPTIQPGQERRCSGSAAQWFMTWCVSSWDRT